MVDLKEKYQIGSRRLVRFRMLTWTVDLWRGLLTWSIRLPGCPWTVDPWRGCCVPNHHKPVINPVQDSTPDGQLREGMSRTDRLEQSVLRAGSIARPETADMLVRHHKQTGCKSSAWPTPVIEMVHNTDVSIDIYTDRPEYLSPSSISDVNLFKCKVQDNREDRPMKGMTNSHQGDLKWR